MDKGKQVHKKHQNENGIVRMWQKKDVKLLGGKIQKQDIRKDLKVETLQEKLIKLRIQWYRLVHEQ
jgi:hypothetical protein